ncbi:MAG: hypothetical protein LBO09_08965 [Candidatus Peribacteria bacterium]|jgi:hypothetical protein|nr:hypothetical protein [Candidatus Peribacteria bacterium]
MVVPGFESPFTPTVNLPNFFDYSDTICGTSGTLLGSEQSDAVGSYCCRYEETA